MSCARRRLLILRNATNLAVQRTTSESEVAAQLQQFLKQFFDVPAAGVVDPDQFFKLLGELAGYCLGDSILRN